MVAVMYFTNLASPRELWELGSALPGTPHVELGTSLRGVYKDAWSDGVRTGPEGLRIFSISFLHRLMSALEDKDVLTLLRPYVGEVSQLAKLSEFVDMRKLASLIVWLVYVLRLRISGVDLAEDPESGEPQFVEIFTEDCGWDQWKILSRAVKSQLTHEGLDDVAGRVALVCKQALPSR